MPHFTKQPTRKVKVEKLKKWGIRKPSGKRIEFLSWIVYSHLTWNMCNYTCKCTEIVYAAVAPLRRFIIKPYVPKHHKLMEWYKIVLRRKLEQTFTCDINNGGGGVESMVHMMYVHTENNSQLEKISIYILFTECTPVSVWTIY